MSTRRIKATVSVLPQETLQVTASPEGLIELADAMTSESYIELLPDPQLAPRDVLAGVIVRHRDGHPGVTISYTADDLVIAGDDDGLAVLIDNVRSLGEDPVGLGGHLHLEHFDGHPYLRSDSIPLLVKAAY